MRRGSLLAICMVAVCGFTPVFGQTVQQLYIEQLTKQGFKNLTISRTWLGRTRITATRKSRQREIIFNTKSGEVLRDYWEDAEDDNGLASDLLDLGSAPSGSAESGSGGEAGSGGDAGSSGGDSGSGGGDSGSGGGSGGGGQSQLSPEFSYLTGGLGVDVEFL